jgi:hypothetical protein
MIIRGTRLSQLAWWRISLVGLCLLGTVVAETVGDWSVPVNLGDAINTAYAEQ